MPKRFTATEKWDDPWFWELSPQAKLLWVFLCDHCDNAGIIQVSFKIASSKIGLPINEKHLAELASRLHTLPCGKVIIIGFIRFQYGKISRDCRPHNPVFESLSKHGTDISQVESLIKGYAKGIDTLQEKVQVQEKEPDKDKEGGIQRGKYHKDARAVLHFLNDTIGKHFRETDPNLTIISARLSEPEVDLEGCKTMIQRQHKKWKGTEFQDFLQPSTLFRASKFDGYYAARDQPIIHENNGPAGSKSFDRNKGTLNEGHAERYDLPKIQAARALRDAGKPESGANA